MGLPPTPPHLPPPAPPLPPKPRIDDLLAWLHKWRWPLTTVVTVGIIALVGGVWKRPYDALVVSMIPVEIPMDEDENPEPSIAVNPSNPDEIVAGGLWMGAKLGCPRTTFGVVYSGDRGKTWTLHCTLPLDFNYTMGDPSFGFAADGSVLFAAAQAWNWDTGDMTLRLFSAKPDPLATTWPVTDLAAPTDASLAFSHMPWVSAGISPATLVAIGGDSPKYGAGDCNSGVVWWNYPTPTNYTTACVSPRLSGPDKWTPVVRTAVHTNGTAYAATYRIVEYTEAGASMDVVVFRHDPTESSAAASDAFSGLKEPSAGGSKCVKQDGLRGIRVVRCVPVPFEDLTAGDAGFGYERRLYSHLALAVDPSKSTHVFVAWGDEENPANGMTLHVRESTDGGQTWTVDDQYKTARSVNPALAVTTDGRLGFSYQQLAAYADGNRWDTMVQIFDAGNVSAGALATLKLASVGAGSPKPCYMPYIGEYMDLKAIDTDFYGVFSTSSDVTASNFPEGVTYVRAPSVPQVHNCPTDASEPEVNIDPYFFRLDVHRFSVALLPFVMRSALNHIAHGIKSIFKRP